MVAHPFHEMPPIAPGDPEPTQLFTCATEPCAEETGSRRVGDRGSRHDHGHEEPQRIHPQMAFTPFDVLAFVIAAFASELGGLDTLTVDAACWRTRVRR